MSEPHHFVSLRRHYPARGPRRARADGPCFSLGLALGLVFAATVAADESRVSGQSTADEARRYTFSWLFTDDAAMKPRGGTTTGPDVTLASEPSAAWTALQEEGMDAQERDRRAILAMAGAYRTTFDFIETIGFAEDYKPSRPYQSWGTEYVYVVEDRPEFVSLQHILVMTVELEDGTLSDPIVIKHWRQDWTWQDRDLQQYTGHNTWRQQRLKRSEARGTWSQAVYQVDDSPRYETYGRWQHEPGYSHWESESTLRPLPRREFSVRDDYHALLGSMRISITPTSWVMEEDALKMVMDEQGEPRDNDPFIAREAGISRYEHIVDYDFSAGDAYWASTGPFWAEVRAYWDQLYRASGGFGLETSVDGTPLYAVIFDLASQYSGDAMDRAAVRADLEAALEPYLKTGVDIAR